MRHHAWAAIAIVALALAPAGALAQSGESVGVITEIKVGKGKVEVKSAGKPDRLAAPFLALRAGDSVRATSDAFAVILLTGGRGTVRIDASSSPYVLTPAGPGEGKLQKAQSLVTGSVNFLSGSSGESPKAVLAVRATGKPAVILSPRNTAVLPGPLTFEWMGTQFSRSTVRVLTPSGVVFEKRGVVGARFEYPDSAPPLRAGVRYTLQLEPATGPMQETTFEMVESARAEKIRRTLQELDDALGPQVPANTAVAIRTGTLAVEGLLHDARLAVLAALARDPDEPSLHTLLGQIYQKAGLADQAAEAFDEAQFLLTRGAN
jgi:hypothetical protein